MSSNPVGESSLFNKAIGTTLEGCTLTSVANQTIVYNGRAGIHTILEPVEDAGYNRSSSTPPVAKCHPDTRKDVIDEIVRWVKHDRTMICWINGSAGSGKSAISQTIAERYAEKNRLAASFFFFRGAGNRSKITRFIHTLAFQLSLSVPSTKPLIEQACGDGQASTALSLKNQFQELVVKPFMKKSSVLPYLKKPMVIVIDGLDECDDKESVVEFIGILADISRSNPRPHFRVIISSRINEHIRKALEQSAARSATYHLALDTFDPRHDIRVFLRSQFSTIYDQNHLRMSDISLPWPPESDLNALVEKCGGSFIMAATIIKVIDDGHLPHRNIYKALKLDSGLDPLYTQVLSNAPRNNHFNVVISTVMLLTAPLSITSLANLLQLTTDDVHDVLLGVQSILNIPGNNNDPIQVFHTSLRDFLVSERSGYFINPPVYHLHITANCLTAIGLAPEDGSFYTGEEQEYACFNWCYHLEQGIEKGLEEFDSVTHLMGCIARFASQSMDFWVNTVIWKGDMKRLLITLSQLQQSAGCPEDLKMNLENIEKHVKFTWSDFQEKHKQKLLHHQGQRTDEQDYRKRTILKWRNPACNWYF